MKKLYLLLILMLFSAQSFAGDCPDGSDPIKSISDDGTYFVYNCGSGNTKKNNSTTQNNSTTKASSKKSNSNSSSDTRIYDVFFEPEILKELLERIVSKTDYDFSQHKLAKNIKASNCIFRLRRVEYDKSVVGIIENWDMARGYVNIKDSNFEFVNSNWRMGGLSNDPSFFQDEVNLKLTEDGHLVGKMAWFNLSVKIGEVALSPTYPTLKKHDRSIPITTSNITKTNAKLWIDVEDWAGGVLNISNCKEGTIKQKEVKKKVAKKVNNSASMPASKNFDGKYLFKLFTVGIFPKTHMGGGFFVIKDGFITIAPENRTRVNTFTGQMDDASPNNKWYNSFNGKVNKLGEINANFLYNPCGSGQCGGDKTFPVNGTIDKLKLNGEFIIDDGPDVTEIIFELEPNSSEVKKVATQEQKGDANISKIVEIIQGDKFIVNISEPHEFAGDSINLSLRDIKAPDAIKSCSRQLEFGAKVKEFVVQKLANATSIKLTNIKKTNTKILAQMLVDGKDLGQELLEKGYGSDNYSYWKLYFCSYMGAANTAQSLMTTGDNENAIFWYKRSIFLSPNDSSVPINTLRISWMYYRMGDEGKSLEYLKKAASLGYWEAEEELGSAYLNGHRGLNKDPNQAIKWLKKAHEHGSQRAEDIYCGSLPKAKQKTCKF